MKFCVKIHNLVEMFVTFCKGYYEKIKSDWENTGHSSRFFPFRGRYRLGYVSDETY